MNKYHAAFVPAALLVVALAPLPYGYYTFLRLVVTGWSLFLAWDEYRRQRSVNVWSISFLLNRCVVQSTSADLLGARELALSRHGLRDPVSVRSPEGVSPASQVKAPDPRFSTAASQNPLQPPFGVYYPERGACG